MSTQLILYPQDYQGYSYNTTPILSQYVSNFDFSSGGIGQANTTNGTLNYMSAILNTGIPVGGWYSFYYSGTPASSYYAAVAAPSIATSQLTLTGASSGSLQGLSGVYQLITGLVTGESYDITINVSSGGSGALYYVGESIWNTSGAAPPTIMIGYLSANTPTTFTATSPTMILVVKYQATVNAVIDNISIQENVISAPQAYNELFDGQVICDLYEEQDIPLTLSIDDFSNVIEKVQSYSKDFDLPNTKRNNQIFTHIFEITKTIANSTDFNPYAKTRAAIKQDGVLIFEGMLRLIDISDNNGEISYNVNLYSETIALAESLENRSFSDLDFTELEHLYDKDSIKNSWNDGVGLPLDNPLATTSFAYDAALGVNNTNVLKYPFCNWVGDIPIADGTSGNNSVLDYPELTSLGQAFRPFVQIKYILDKIFDNVGYQYTSTFFNTTEFKKLFMDFNWGSGNMPSLSNVSQRNAYFRSETSGHAFVSNTYSALIVNFSANDLANLPLVDYNTSTHTITAPADNIRYTILYEYKFQTLVSSPQPVVSCRWLHTEAATGNTTEIDLMSNEPVNVGTDTVWGGYNWVDIVMNNGDTLVPQAKATLSTVKQSYYPNPGTGQYNPPSSAHINIQKRMLNITTGSLLNTLRGELGQWEFFKGLMTMFNLVTMADPDNPNNIIIEPYSDIFGNSPAAVTPVTHNWTYKVDVKQINLKPLELKRKVVLKYSEDDEDYPFRVYKNATAGYLYGSKELDGSSIMLSTNQVTNLIGEEEIVAEPFAATVCKPLSDIFGNWIIPTIYSSNEDGTEFEGFDNKPRILYNDGVVTIASGGSYYIPAAGSLSSENQTQFLQFSHLSAIQPTPTDNDYNFGSCQLIGINTPPPNNLYNLYYSDYFNNLYNPDTRIMTLKVNLNASDINTFKFYDKVFIKNREFRVNKINYTPNGLSTVEFILL